MTLDDSSDTAILRWEQEVYFLGLGIMVGAGSSLHFTSAENMMSIGVFTIAVGAIVAYTKKKLANAA